MKFYNFTNRLVILLVMLVLLLPGVVMAQESTETPHFGTAVHTATPGFGTAVYTATPSFGTAVYTPTPGFGTNTRHQVMVAQVEPTEAAPAETVTFETNTPQGAEVEPTEAATEEATPIPAVTDVPVTPEPDPVDEPDAGISEATLNSFIGLVGGIVIAGAAIIIVVVIVFGLLQGKSLSELAHSQPVQWGLTAAANAAAITTDTTDDEWIAARAKQLGWEVANVDGVITLKKVEIPPISLPVG
jgi:hypothetical protein